MHSVWTRAQTIRVFGQRAKSKIAGASHVALAVVFCVFHQYSLATKGVAELHDTHQWSNADHGVSYVSGVGTIANTWRAPGVTRKLLDRCGLKYDDEGLLVRNRNCSFMI